MGIALSIVPSSGPGDCYRYPGSMLTPPEGGCFQVPLSVGHLRDNSKGRSEVHPLYPLGVPPVNEKHDGDHKDGPTN